MMKDATPEKMIVRLMYASPATTRIGIADALIQITGR
jgi:hypothetical protein